MSTEGSRVQGPVLRFVLLEGDRNPEGMGPNERLQVTEGHPSKGNLGAPFLFSLSPLLPGYNEVNHALSTMTCGLTPGLRALGPLTSAETAKSRSQNKAFLF